MSKGSERPTALSFENPHKAGWLHKHGGSGVSSHWKKRWFIVEKNYMFYYKGPNDKKPVGILCLLDYQSCHKASSKESKKANSFVLERGSSDLESTDTGPSKNYVLCSDSEDDLESWLTAIAKEMQASAGSRVYSKTLPPRIDSKVFDEVTAIVCEAPKLIHLTTSRPRMRGRRPPKKYAVFHEDDSKDDDSPSGTTPVTSPCVDRHLLVTPETSPSSSPTVAAKKGNHPSAPMLPKVHMMPPPNKPEITKEQGESVSTPPRPPTKPEPPKKPISRDREGSTTTSIDDSTHAAARTPHKPVTRPVPPKKHVTTSEPSQVEALPKLPNGAKPLPIARPRHTTRTKPQSNVDVSDGGLSKKAFLEEPAEPMTPVKKPRPPPTSRKPDAVKAECVNKLLDVEEEEKHGKEEPKLPDQEEPKLPDKEELPKLEEPKLSEKEEPNLEEPKLPDKEEPKLPDKEEPDKEEPKLEEPKLLEPKLEEPKLPDKEEPKLPDKEEPKLEEPDKEEPKLPDKEEPKLPDNEEPKLPANGVILEVSADGEQQGSVDDTDSGATTPEGRKEEEMEKQVVEKGSINESINEEGLDLYEIITAACNEDDQESEQNSADGAYEVMTYNHNPSDKFQMLDSKAEEDDLYISSDIGISPAACNIEVRSTHQPPPGSINPENVCIDKVEDAHLLESQGHNLNTATELETKTHLGHDDFPSYDPLECPIYDVLDAPKPVFVEDGNMSTAIATDIAPSPSPKVKTKSHRVTSNSSSTSDDSNTQATEEYKEGSKTLPRNMKAMTVTDLDLESQGNLMNVSIKQADIVDEKGLNSLRFHEQESESVSKVLQQARELLRQAKSAKAEADQFRDESSRELELARRERHDASLLKKNAAEILKIAKTKLDGKH